MRPETASVGRLCTAALGYCLFSKQGTNGIDQASDRTASPDDDCRRLQNAPRKAETTQRAKRREPALERPAAGQLESLKCAPDRPLASPPPPHTTHHAAGPSSPLPIPRLQLNLTCSPISFDPVSVPSPPPEPPFLRRLLRNCLWGV